MRGHPLADWLRREVLPGSAFWRERLHGYDVGDAGDLRWLPVAEEAELAGAGGPGNPALLVLPSEEDFKRHATRKELWAAAREAGGRGADGRRAAWARRYKPAHVHDAGVASPLAVVYSRTDLDRLQAAGARLAAVLGLTSDDAIVNAVPAQPSVRFWGLYHAALGGGMTALHPRGAATSDPLRAVARAFALLPATVLATPVWEAEWLLAGLAERGVDLRALRTVLTVGPPPTPQLRVAIAAAAGGPRVQAVWAPEPARALWGECRPPGGDPPEATYGLHTYPDLEVVEVRDVVRDEPAEPGQAGELVYTSLGWRGTAVIRLATGAWTGGLVTGVPCPACGRSVPRLAPAAGDAAWQPRVQTDRGMVRVDLRRAARLLQPARLRRFGVRDWSLGEQDGRLVLGLGGVEETAAGDLARAVGEAVGVVPDVRVAP